jgi:Protein of unknown function (DUF1279)
MTIQTPNPSFYSFMRRRRRKQAPNCFNEEGSPCHSKHLVRRRIISTIGHTSTTMQQNMAGVFHKASSSSPASRSLAALFYRRIYHSLTRNPRKSPLDHCGSQYRRSLASKPDDRSVSDRLRDQYHERSQAFHDSVDDRREALRDRATHYRDSAATRLREFKENPKQTALDGAKSFTTMLRMYGPVFIGTYAAVYFTTLSGLYAGVASGALDPVALFTTLGIIPTAAATAADAGATVATTTITTTTTVDLVYNVLDHHEITKSYAHYVQDYPALANLGVAWISVKFTEPIRLPVAISITPRVARYIGYRPKVKEQAENDKKDESSSSSS